MTSGEIRRKYLEFFKARGHEVIPSASLIPENDPTVLFTTAGMQPLVPYLLGEKHPLGKRLVDAQKCIRTTDIEEVGDNRHLTFFEMLGNWSLGDYFKKEAIAWSWEFLTEKEYLGLDPQRLYVTVFLGDSNSPIDQESILAWQEQFAKADIEAQVCDYNQPIAGNRNFRIFPLPAKDNWWGPAGQTGPCGPCSEMFYDVLPDKGMLEKTFDDEINSGRIMEIWNDVFMEFNKTSEGKFEKLAQQNVDTGMGLERTTSTLNGKEDVFDNELFYPLFKKVEELSGRKYGESPEITKAMRTVVDHIKAATFILAEGLEPTNVEHGYILRRLIRRAVRYGKQLGINDSFTFKVAWVVIEMYLDVYPELSKNKSFIKTQLAKEEEDFEKSEPTREKQTITELEKRKQKDPSTQIDYVTGDEIYNIYGVTGVSGPDIVRLAEQHNIKVRRPEDYEVGLRRHQELSRAGARQKFVGGLADHSEQTIKYHTSAHLMLAALRQVLGDHIAQKGSNITAERLRFDFSHPQKMTPEEIKKVEDLVNQKIQENLPVKMEEMSLREAQERGAAGVFQERYGERVKVYTIGNPSASSGHPFSREICGGPHVASTKELGRFKIIKEEAVGQSVRRVKAILENDGEKNL